MSLARSLRKQKSKIAPCNQRQKAGDGQTRKQTSPKWDPEGVCCSLVLPAPCTCVLAFTALLAMLAQFFFLFNFFFNITLHQWCTISKKKGSNSQKVFKHYWERTQAGRRLNSARSKVQWNIFTEFLLNLTHLLLRSPPVHPSSERAPALPSCRRPEAQLPTPLTAVLLTAAPLRAAWFVGDEASVPHITAFLSEQEPYHKL